MQEHKPCYGELFPLSTRKESGKERPGSAFGFEYPDRGSIALRPQIVTDLTAWDCCVACREFSSCQQLSTAKLLLEIAARC